MTTDPIEERKKKLACFRCLGRKEKLDRIERYFLMWEAGIKQLRSDVTHLVKMKNELDEKVEELKNDFNEDFIGCL